MFLRSTHKWNRWQAAQIAGCQYHERVSCALQSVVWIRQRSRFFTIETREVWKSQFGSKVKALRVLALELQTKHWVESLSSSKLVYISLNYVYFIHLYTFRQYLLLFVSLRFKNMVVVCRYSSLQLQFRGKQELVPLFQFICVGYYWDLVSRFAAQGSLPSQCDGPFTSGLPRPGAQLRPSVNVGQADMRLWHAVTQHGANATLMFEVSEVLVKQDVLQLRGLGGLEENLLNKHTLCMFATRSGFIKCSPLLGSQQMRDEMAVSNYYRCDWSQQDMFNNKLPPRQCLFMGKLSCSACLTDNQWSIQPL